MVKSEKKEMEVFGVAKLEQIGKVVIVLEAHVENLALSGAGVEHW